MDGPPHFEDDDMGLELEDGPAPSGVNRSGNKKAQAPSSTLRGSPQVKFKPPAKDKNSLASSPSPPQHSSPSLPSSTHASLRNPKRPTRPGDSLLPAKSHSSLPPAKPPTPIGSQSRHQTPREDSGRVEEHVNAHGSEGGAAPHELLLQRIHALEAVNTELEHKLDEKDKAFATEWDDRFWLPLIAQIDSMPESVLHTKIVEMAKKNKSLTIQLEKEKTKGAKLGAQLEGFLCSTSASASLNSQRTSLVPLVSPSSSPSPAPAPSYDDAIKEIKTMKTRLARLSTETTALRQENDELKTSLNSLKSILQRELGENVGVETVMTSSAGWQGRGEQVAMLKARIKELQVERPETNNVRARAAIEQIASDKKKDQERVATDLATVKLDLQDAKLKIEGLASKNKILKNDNEQLKQKLKVVLDKTENDDKLIQLLQKEMQRLNSG